MKRSSMKPEYIPVFEAKKRANETVIFKPIQKTVSWDEAELKLNVNEAENLRKAQLFRDLSLRYISQDERNILTRAWGPINGLTIYEDYLEKRHDTEFKSQQKQLILDKIRPLINNFEFRGYKTIIPVNYKGKGRNVAIESFPVPEAPKPLNKKPSIYDLTETKRTLKYLTQENINTYNEIKQLLDFFKQDILDASKNPTVANKEKVKSIMAIIEGAMMRTETKKYKTDNEISRMIADDILFSQIRNLFEYTSDNLKDLQKQIVIEKLVQYTSDIIPLFETVEKQFNIDVNEEQAEKKMSVDIMSESSRRTTRSQSRHQQESASEATATPSLASTSTGRRTRSQASAQSVVEVVEPGPQASAKEKLDYFKNELSSKYLSKQEIDILMDDWGKSGYDDLDQGKPRKNGATIYYQFHSTIHYAQKYSNQKGHLLPILMKITPLINEITFRTNKSTNELHRLITQEDFNIEPVATPTLDATPATEAIVSTPPKDFIIPTIQINPDDGVMSPLPTKGPGGLGGTKKPIVPYKPIIVQKRPISSPTGDTPQSKLIDDSRTPPTFRNLAYHEQEIISNFTAEMQRLETILQSNTFQPAEAKTQVKKTVRFITDKVQPMMQKTDEPEPLRRSARIRAKNQYKTQVVDPLLKVLKTIDNSDTLHVATPEQKQRIATYTNTLVSMTPPRSSGPKTPVNTRTPHTPAEMYMTPGESFSTPIESFTPQPTQNTRRVLLAEPSPVLVREATASVMTSVRASNLTTGSYTEDNDYVEIGIYLPDITNTTPGNVLRTFRLTGPDLLWIAKYLKQSVSS